jgi:hypothetical protein
MSIFTYVRRSFPAIQDNPWDEGLREQMARYANRLLARYKYYDGFLGYELADKVQANFARVFDPEEWDAERTIAYIQRGVRKAVLSYARSRIRAWIKMKEEEE